MIVEKPTAGIILGSYYKLKLLKRPKSAFK